MQRMTLQVGTYEVNCSILADGESVYIVDPGGEGERILSVLAKKGLTPTAILLTHAHFDHVGAIPALQAAYPDLPVYVGAADGAIIDHPLNQMPPDYPPIARPANLTDALTLKGVDVIETPGHTPGGVSYWFREAAMLFSGDTLFAGSVGRTDFPGGSMTVLMQSLQRLMTLPDATLVVPGHGPVTTIDRERRLNPFLF